MRKKTYWAIIDHVVRQVLSVKEMWTVVEIGDWGHGNEGPQVTFSVFSAVDDVNEASSGAHGMAQKNNVTPAVGLLGHVVELSSDVVIAQLMETFRIIGNCANVFWGS